MEKKVAKGLLDIQAVFLKPNDPFTWASGIKSPIYCDNRLTLSDVELRTTITEGLCNIIKENFADCNLIMGTATAGIPQAALVAHKLELPMGYVRSSNKSHGRQNNIEGKYKAGDKVVVVEDLISTAGSSIDVVKTLQEAGCEVLGIASIFTYGLQKGLDNLKNSNVINHSISNYDVLIDVAVENNYVSSDDVAKLKKFISNPSDESWMK